MWGKICMEKGKQLPLQERTKKTYMAETVCTYKKRQKHTPMPIRTQRHTSDDNSLTVDYDFGDTDFGYAKSVEELNVALDHADAVRNDSSHWRTFPEFIKDFKQGLYKNK